MYGPTSALVSQRLVNPTNQINWDRDGNSSEDGIIKNINNLGSSIGCSSTLNTPLLGYEDWSHLQNWTKGSNYANRTVFNATGLANLTDSAILIDATNFTAVGNSPLAGNFPLEANLTGAENFTTVANVTITGIGIPWDARECLVEKNVDNLKKSTVTFTINTFVCKLVPC